MVAPFSEAVAALEKGKYTKEPVKTQFGYHVILKEDSRPVTPPPLEAVKEQLTPFLQRKKVQSMIETLRNQAKVEVLVPLTEEKPKTEVAPAPAPAEQPAAEPAVPATEPAKAAEPAPAAPAETKK
jgi:peptidyl-prolyl cis-trans isomerase C